MKHAIRRLVLLAAVSAFAGPAAAIADDFGTYTQYACRTPDGSPAPADGFHKIASSDGTCGPTGSLELSLDSKPDGCPYCLDDSWSYTSPDTTSIVGATIRRSATGLSGDSEMQYYGLEMGDKCDPAHDCTTPADVTWQGSTSQLSFDLGCTNGYYSCRSTTGTSKATVSISKVAVRLQDKALPEFSSTPAGPLLTSPVQGNQSLNFTAKDAGGGIYQSALVVDGVEQPRQVLDDNNGECRQPFVYAVPCKATMTGTLALDTTSLPDGHHTIGVVVYDATGTNSVRYGPVPVDVDNVPDPSDTRGPEGNQTSGSGTRPAVHIEGLGRFAHTAVRASFARPTVVHGRLLDTAGQPIASATLIVSTAIVGGTEHVLGNTVTDAKGNFSVVLPKGSSRRVTVRYEPTDDRAAAAWNFRLVVPAPLKLSASRLHLTNGRKLMLTAYLGGAKVPARSAAVAFQVLIGHQWRTFATRNIRPDGVARIGHRFRVTYQRLTYRFRAVAVGRKYFPFANSTSSVVAVRVN